MSNLTWIKLAIGIFDDEKVKIIESMPDRDAILICWFKLLTLAGKINDGGYIYITKGEVYTDETLATVLSRPLNTVRLAIGIFKKYGMLHGGDGTGEPHYLPNWAKYQDVNAMDYIAEYHREQTRNRVARWRERQKQLALPEPVTLQDVTSNGEDKIRIDKEENRKVTLHTLRNANWHNFYNLRKRQLEKELKRELNEVEVVALEEETDKKVGVSHGNQ